MSPLSHYERTLLQRTLELRVTLTAARVQNAANTAFDTGVIVSG